MTIRAALQTGMWAGWGQCTTACAILHNICLGSVDIMPLEDELQDGMLEDEEEDGLEATSGAPWCRQDWLSAEVSALEEGNHDQKNNKSAICQS